MSAPTPTLGDRETAMPAGFDPNFLGVIAPLPGVGARPVVERGYTHLSVRLDTTRALAVCAAVNIDGGALTDLPRADDWQIDPRVPEDAQSGEELYERNSLDRGHLVRRRDPCWGAPESAQQANADTFHHVNAAPQVAIFDQSKDPWLWLEIYFLDAAAAAGARLSVLTGPVLAEDDPTYRGVQIPRWFSKIAGWTDDQRGGELAATGYLLDQSALLGRISIDAPPSLREQEPQSASGDVELGAYRTIQVPIIDIEILTGLDLTVITAADRMAMRLSALPGQVDLGRWVPLDGVEHVSAWARHRQAGQVDESAGGLGPATRASGAAGSVAGGVAEIEDHRGQRPAPGWIKSCAGVETDAAQPGSGDGMPRAGLAGRLRGVERAGLAHGDHPAEGEGVWVGVVEDGPPADFQGQRSQLCQSGCVRVRRARV